MNHLITYYVYLYPQLELSVYLARPQMSPDSFSSDPVVEIETRLPSPLSSVCVTNLVSESVGE